jgi:hypothetical protein
MKAYGLIALTAMVGLASTLGVVACSDDGTLGGGSPPGSSSGGTSGGGTSGGGTSGGGTSSGDNGRAQENVEGDITTDRTLTKDKNWLLKGLVSVKPGATLTIEAGTVVKGDNASKAILLIEAGAKIQAVGTAEEPIIFTSQAAEGQKKAGDWGGLILLGKAPTNWRDGTGNPTQGSVEGILKTGQTATRYGGNDPNDSSGALQYVRVEYSGVVVATDNEVNGITFAGVGRGTKVDHIQVRKTLDDCFEFFGGTVDAKYLACQHNQDDGFDFDNGFTGRLQFLVLQQDPNHEGDDNGFESDNNAEGNPYEPFTSPTVYNATLIGKNKTVGGAQFGFLLRRNTRGTYRNVVVSGFQAAIDVRDDIGAPGALSIANSLVWNSVGAGAAYPVTDHIAFIENQTTVPAELSADDAKKYKARPDWADDTTDEVVWFKGFQGNKFDVDPAIASAFNATAPVFGPTTSLTEGAATPPAEFFDPTATYKGAFKDANDKWATTGKWAVWSDK